ncbi:Protein of unknown function [Evansella caseinilytica]|uniref:DUF2487 family protein n=1 Tax=Evansella caseinilytica TaxID=1503961 RepID=A0A1H3NHI9_9BACI|nr:YpiF family protein [Evansella caseinilytica]SDY87689.1 Protein of unknown function [Evansella caseinilytica]
MKWRTEQMDTYLNAKEYVDTAIIPLMPVDWNNDPKGKVSMGEFTTLLVDELERQFKGRVFQIPPFVYLTSEDDTAKRNRLLAWDKHFFNNGFKYIIYVTSDGEWKRLEKELPDMLLWIPSLSLEAMDESYAKQIVDQQMKQILPLIANKWREEPAERS